MATKTKRASGKKNKYNSFIVIVRQKKEKAAKINENERCILFLHFKKRFFIVLFFYKKS